MPKTKEPHELQNFIFQDALIITIFSQTLLTMPFSSKTKDMVHDWLIWKSRQLVERGVTERKKFQQTMYNNISNKQTITLMKHEVANGL